MKHWDWDRARSFLTKTFMATGAALVVMFSTIPDSLAQASDVVMPPLSVAKWQYLRAHPDELDQFLSHLPKRPVLVAEPAIHRAATPAGSPWQTVTPASTANGLCSPLLLTDGTVMLADCGSAAWWKLTPDINGNYATGTWSQIASLPVIGGTQYAPLYHASAVLPDGRAIIMGGEYNDLASVWTNLGAIYDPVANGWTAVPAPSGAQWANIGDAQGTVLADGTWMLAACCAGPAVDALFNPTTLGWTATGAPNAGDNYQDEQGYELLPNGNVLTIDIWTNSSSGASGGNATNAEQYSPATGTWSSAGSTPVSLPDPAACDNYEIGPAVLRPDGTVVAFGGNTGCVTGATADPTAVYSSSSGTWTAGPNIPSVCGSGTTSCSLADAPAALLPNGNVLFAASSEFGNAPTHFFEFTTSNTINQVSDPVHNASSSGAYYYNFLVLPSGQILVTDYSNIAEIYTPTGSPNAGWAPVITTIPTTLAPGSTYSVSGTQLNGLSQGAYYGDDAQMATNYPLVRIVNSATGHVFYARTYGHSTMSVAPGTAGTTNFSVPNTIETGPSTVSVVANGIASQPVSVTVGRLISTTTGLAVSPTTAAPGVAVSFTALVTAGTGATPTGTVSFSDSATPLGTVTLNGAGQAVFTTSKLASGTHSAKAVYSGSASDAPSTSSVVTVTITQGAVATKTTLSAPSSVVYGKPVELSVTVKQASGTTLPTGAVSFLLGSTVLGSATLNSAGKAIFAALALPVGTYSFSAVYGGSSTELTSTSNSITVTITQAATATALTASSASASFGTAVRLTAKVAATTGSIKPQGTVSFSRGSVSLGSATLSTEGIATLSTSTLPVGTDTVKAVYAGDADDAVSTSNSVAVTINAFATKTVLSASPKSGAPGTTIVLTATVKPTSGNTVPTGTVNFYDGSKSLGVGKLSSGAATLSISTLGAGTHEIKATFLGSTDDLESTSALVAVTIT